MCSPEDNKIIESIATGGHEVRPYGMKILYHVVNLESRIVGENYCSPEDNKIVESITPGWHKTSPYGMIILYYVVNLGISDCRGELLFSRR